MTNYPCTIKSDGSFVFPNGDPPNSSTQRVVKGDTITFQVDGPGNPFRHVQGGDILFGTKTEPPIDGKTAASIVVDKGEFSLNGDTTVADHTSGKGHGGGNPGGGGVIVVGTGGG